MCFIPLRSRLSTSSKIQLLENYHGQGNKVVIGTTAGAVEAVRVDATWHFTKDFEKYYRVKNPELVEVLDEVVS